MNFRIPIPKAMTEPAIIVIIGVALSAVGAIVGGIGAYRASTKQDREKAQFERELRLRSDAQVESQKKLAEKSDEIATLNRQIAESQKDLRERSDEIAALNQSIAEAQRDLRIKSDEIAQLNKQTADSIIGGDSFCYMAFSSLNGINDLAQLVLIHKGNYPLYEVGVRIVDIDEFKKMQVKTLDDFLKSEIRGNLGNIAANQARVIGNLKLPNTQSQDYNIFFSARNGFWTQLVRLRKIRGVWKTAYQVTNTPTSKTVKIIFEQIDPDYPRRADGQVEWE